MEIRYKKLFDDHFFVGFVVEISLHFLQFILQCVYTKVPQVYVQAKRL